MTFIFKVKYRIEYIGKFIREVTVKCAQVFIDTTDDTNRHDVKGCQDHTIRQDMSVSVRL